MIPTTIPIGIPMVFEARPQAQKAFDIKYVGDKMLSKQSVTEALDSILEQIEAQNALQVDIQGHDLISQLSRLTKPIPDRSKGSSIVIYAAIEMGLGMERVQSVLNRIDRALMRTVECDFTDAASAISDAKTRWIE